MRLIGKSPRSFPFSSWALCAAAVAGAGQWWTAVGMQVRGPRLHVVTFMNRLERHFAYLQVSAEAHALSPTVVGYGMSAWWPDGLGTKINALRGFVMGTVDDDDIVLFADAFDVMIFGDGGEIVSRFEELERSSSRSLIFNAEESCFPQLDGVCDERVYPSAPHRWRYLNSGVIVGRGAALKNMLKDPVPDIIEGSDQFWYQQYFRSHRNSILLDTNCSLVCAVTGDGPTSGAVLRDGRVWIPETGATPPVVHFVSVAHWPAWRDGEPTSPLHDTFRLLYPLQARRLFHELRIQIFSSAVHSSTLYEGAGWWRLMRGLLCVNCRVLGSKHHECKYFPSMFDAQCWSALAILVTAVVCPSFVTLKYAWKYKQVPLPHSSSGNSWAGQRPAAARFRVLERWLGSRNRWGKLPESMV